MGGSQDKKSIGKHCEMNPHTFKTCSSWLDLSCQLRAQEQGHLETYYHGFGEQERGEHFQKTSMQTDHDKHCTCFPFLGSLTLRHPLIHHYDLFLQSLRVVLKEDVSYRLKKVEVRRKDAIDQVIFDKKKASTK